MSADRPPSREPARVDGPAAAPERDVADAHDLGRRVLDVLDDGEGPVRVDDLARRLAESERTADRVEGMERQLLAGAIPALLDRGAIAFSPERWTVTTPAADEGPARRQRLVGSWLAGVAASVAVAGAGFGWAPPALGAVAGVLLLSLGVIAYRHPHRPDRTDAPVRSLDPGGTPDPATLEVADRSPDQRILGLLLASGGRLHQQAIVARLGHSESTVSRHLSTLAEAGHLAKVSVGRENLVCLPSARPDGAGTGPRESSVPGADAGD